MDAHAHLPPGYRFRPTNEELVFSYLLPRIRGRAMPGGVIKELVDFYASEPRDLPGQSYQGADETQWYLLSKGRRRQDKKKQVNRKTNEGSWRVTGEPLRITLAGHEEVGVRRIFVFYKGLGRSASVWVMHEYSLEEGEGQGGPAGQGQEEPFTICKLFRKDNETGRAVDPVSGLFGTTGGGAGGEIGLWRGDVEETVNLVSGLVGAMVGVTGGETGIEGRKRQRVEWTGCDFGGRKRLLLEEAVKEEEKVDVVEAVDGGRVASFAPAAASSATDPIPVSPVSDEACSVVPVSPETEEERGVDVSPWDVDQPAEVPGGFDAQLLDVDGQHIDSDFLAEVEALESFEQRIGSGKAEDEDGEARERVGNTVLGVGHHLPWQELPPDREYVFADFDTSTALGVEDSRLVVNWVQSPVDGGGEGIGRYEDAFLGLGGLASCGASADGGDIDALELDMELSAELELHTWVRDCVDVPSSPGSS